MRFAGGDAKQIVAVVSTLDVSILDSVSSRECSHLVKKSLEVVNASKQRGTRYSDFELGGNIGYRRDRQFQNNILDFEPFIHEATPLLIAGGVLQGFDGFPRSVWIRFGHHCSGPFTTAV
jgi:hypothetical protein